jgi:hypothetical protein
VPDFPKLAKDARLLAPKRPSVTGRVVVLCGTTLASIGVLASPVARADTRPATTVVRVASPISGSSAAALVLTPQGGLDILAQHRSHASHSSHYSSSTGSKTPTAPPPATKSSSSASEDKPQAAASSEKAEPSSSSDKQSIGPATNVPSERTTTIASATPPAADHAAVTFTSLPALAEIEVDGKYVGNTRSNLRLAPGTYQVTIKRDGYRPWTRTIEVTAGSEIAVHADLHSNKPVATKTAPTGKK